MSFSENPRLVAWWRFDEGAGDVAADASGHGHTLTAHGEPAWVDAPGGGGVRLDGRSEWLTSNGPVLRTDDSYSVAAWVRLERASLGDELRLPDGWFAITALAQLGPSATAPTHTPFYLGARAENEESNEVVRWCFEVAPEDGTKEALLAGPPWPYNWENAFSEQVLDSSVLDTWVLLVGVCDYANLTTHLYVPSTGDHGTAKLVDNWPIWQAEGALQVGRAYWLCDPVDHWHGSIGPVRLYQGVLTMADAQRIHDEDLRAGG